MRASLLNRAVCRRAHDSVRAQKRPAFPARMSLVLNLALTVYKGSMQMREAMLTHGLLRIGNADDGARI
jgi:hypothetical protein